MLFNFLVHEDSFFLHIFIKKNFRKKLAENLLGSGSGSGRFRKSDPDPVKKKSSGFVTLHLTR
jgi:hypothetical protein